jgi:hypothetical protein
LLSLPAGTEMFHFPALPPAALCIQAGATPHDGGRVSPFGNPRITAWLPAPRGISQAPASFIGSWYQGIHRVLLKTWLHVSLQKYAEEPPALRRGQGSSRYIDARVHCAVLKKQTAPQPPTRIRGRRPMACTEDPGRSPFPQDPTACPEPFPAACPRSVTPKGKRTNRTAAGKRTE